MSIIANIGEFNVPCELEALEETLSYAVRLRNGVTVLNVAGGHELTFLHADGTVEVVPFCGWAVTADVVEEARPVWGQDLIEFVHTSFASDPDVRVMLGIMRDNLPPNSVIVGSIIAAQAYPGYIVSAIQIAPDRNVPPAQRVYRTRPDKFNVAL